MFGLGEKRWHIEVSEDDSAEIIEEFKNEGAAQVEKILKLFELKKKFSLFYNNSKVALLSNVVGQSFSVISSTNPSA
jgi:hypothetical protein